MADNIECVSHVYLSSIYLLWWRFLLDVLLTFSWVVSLFLGLEISFHSLNTSLLSNIHCSLPFHSLSNVPWRTGAFVLIKFNLSICFLIDCTLVSVLSNLCTRLQSFSFMFLPKAFIVLGFTFRPIIYLFFIFLGMN